MSVMLHSCFIPEACAISAILTNVILQFRWQVQKFVLAGSVATRALFTRLQQRNTILKSISLLDCLLAAHAAIVTTSECLGAALGNAGGPETQQVLQVCWNTRLEALHWQSSHILFATF